MSIRRKHNGDSVRGIRVGGTRNRIVWESSLRAPCELRLEIQERAGNLKRREMRFIDRRMAMKISLE